MLLVFLCFSIAAGVFAILSLFHNNGQALVQACLDGNSTLDQATCQATAKIVEIIVVVIYVIVWLLQLCA